MMQSTVSSTTLIKSTIAAIVVAAIMLVSFILPAEYNIDPLGVGESLGLTKLAQTSEAAPAPAKTSAPALTPAVETDFVNLSTPSPAMLKPTEMMEETIQVEVPAGRGVEYKFNMDQYAKLTYEWSTGGDPLYFDLHGEPKGDTTGYFESYTIATSDKMKGSFTTPFEGSHGWYWKNSTFAAVTVTLTVKGHYRSGGLK